MTPYYEHGAVTLYKGDCRAVLREVAPASVAPYITTRLNAALKKGGKE